MGRNGWASLPTDIVGLVVRRLLAGDGDIVDYISFRAVCFFWRACTPQLREPTLRDRRLRPCGWVALCGADAVRPDEAREIAFFHTRTSRRIRVQLPELRGHRIVGFTDGLVILLHKRTSAVRVLHPFTRVAVDLPSLARVYRRDSELGRWKHNLLVMRTVVCDSANSANSIAVVVWFPWRMAVFAAEPGDSDWKVLHREYIQSMLPYQGRLYATFSTSREIVQLYPPRLEGSPAVVAHIPVLFGNQYSRKFFLVESGGLMLVAAQYPHGDADVGFGVWEVHLSSSSGGIGKLIRDLPSLSSNSIYYDSLPGSPVVVHSLRTQLSEQLADHCQIHDKVDRIRPSVRPFTIFDHLLTYCHHPEWAEGLMFHEYHYIPESFKELKMSIHAKELQLRIPCIRGE
ncbi:unnamed protein product [Alopecurus aequalis]